MKKRSTLVKMLLGERRRVTAKIGSVSTSDGETGVSSLSLDGTVGGFRPLALCVAGASVPSGASFDSPCSIPYVGEHAVDRIGRGFFEVFAENETELLYDTKGLAEGESVTVTVTLGTPYEGSLSVSIGGESLSREISGTVGDSLSLSFSCGAAPVGRLTLLCSADGILRLTLNGSREAGEGRALTLLSHDGDGKCLTSTRVLLPTPLCSVSVTCENILYLNERRIQRSLGFAEIPAESEIGFSPHASSTDPCAFVVSHGIGEYAGGELYSPYGRISRVDSEVLSGRREGLSLLSGDPSRLGFTLSFSRLTQGVLALSGELRGNTGSGTPNSPVRFNFFPSEGALYFQNLGGTRFSLTQNSPLHCVGAYSDRLFVNGSNRVALRETRIGKLVLTGEERMQFSLKEGYSVATIPFSGGQLTSPQNDLPQLCTHAEVSSRIALTAPEEVASMAVYLSGSALRVAMKRGNSYAESEFGFRSFLRSLYSTTNPFSCYYPLAEVRYESIPLTPIASSGSVSGMTAIYPKVIYEGEGETLLSLARLWLFGKSRAPWVLYPLRYTSSLGVAAPSGELRLPDGGTVFSVVGEAKPRMLSLSAYVYLDGVSASTPGAAESENTSVPQKGTK